MTEAEWLSTTYPRPLLASLDGVASERRLRLFASACCRRIWHLFADPRCRQSVEAVERYADGKATGGELDEARAAVRLVNAFDPAVTFFDRNAIYASRWVADQYAINSAVATAESATAAISATTSVEHVFQTALIRDIFGNPFRPITLLPEWRTDTAIALARQMYESREFSAMPILADALQDAGCDNTDILSHCRDLQQVHVRGCWVVDLVLGKE